MKDSVENKLQNRGSIIVRTSIIGIAANVLLALFKAIVGIITNSIAITLDAVNNISDAASSVITIVGTKLAGKQPDKKHPFGYGRIEYLSAMIISIIVLYAGITSFTESIKKIVYPNTPEYSAAALIIVGAGVAVKIILGRYVKTVGERVNSDSLINSGEDATLDSIISGATLVAAVFYLLTDISLEAYLGTIISVVIIKSGIEMLLETLSKILGEHVDLEQAQAIKSTVLEFPDVHGVYDLVLHDYGPDMYQGSLHIEVPDKYSASELDQLLRSIQIKVMEEHHIILTAIGVYSINTRDKQVMEFMERIRSIALSHKHIKQLHGFYLDQKEKVIRFDLVVSFDARDRRAVYDQVIDEIQKAYPDYELQVAMDTDFSES